MEILFKTILLFLFLDSAIFQSGTCYPEVRSIWHINLISICCTFFLFLVSAIFQSSTCYTEARFVELLNLVYDLFYIVFRQIPERQQIVIDPKGPFFLFSAIFQSGNCYPDARSIWRINLSSNCFSFFSSSFRHIPIRHLLHRGQICLTHKSYFYLLYFLFISSFRHIPIRHLLYGGNICWTP